MSIVFYFVLLVGILVFVHEYGHYIVARLFKVHVIQFAIGFGPRIFSFKRKETEWSIRLLPLGGYVSMLGADPSDDIPVELHSVSFAHKPLWQRALIIFAGPLFNLLLPLPILFVILSANYDEDIPPMIGQVVDGSASDGILQRGDEIIAIEGEEVRYWKDLKEHVEDAAGEELVFTVVRDGETVDLPITPKATELPDPFDLVRREVGRIGVTPGQYEPILGISDPASPARAAGLETFDRVVTINGKTVDTFSELDAVVRESSPGSSVDLVVLRENALQLGMGRVGALAPQKVAVTVADAGGHGTIGVEPASLYVADVDPESPAGDAGLQRGDKITALNGDTYNYFPSLLAELANNWEDTHIVSIERDGVTKDLELQPRKVNVIGEFKEERPVILIGFYNMEHRVMPDLVEVTWGDRLAYGAKRSVSITVDSSGLLVLMLFRMAEGRVSTKSIGGPIMIGALAGKAGDEGVESFLFMLAMLSINLGIINLLPIPVLDGGHLLLFGIEAVKREPLSLRTRQIATYIGLSIVLFLLLFAFKNDIERYFFGAFS